jgi:predicted polyphosphate/ATP-dependent NAD kinase
MSRVGFLINPIAGLGGTVGLKGTDGKVDEAVRRGAVPRAFGRAIQALKALRGSEIHFFTCSGPMGEEAMKSAGITSYTVVYETPEETVAQDTRDACTAFLERGADVIAFCGGDGTARDVYDVAGSAVPLLGIPAGVKMYSGVFAVTPDAAAEILKKAGDLPCRDAEIMDIDEEAYRAGILSTHLYGYACVPYIPSAVQESKAIIESRDEDQAKEEIARFIGEVIGPETVCILGPGTTTEAIARRLGVAKTLLGVDVIQDGRVRIHDADESALLELMEQGERCKIVLSPIGAQGCIIGRGNQQISARVLRAAGIRNVIVVGTPEKLLQTPALFVDTGDPALNSEFGEYISVICGYRMGQRKRLVLSVQEKTA